MTQITIISVGTIKESYLLEGIAEYKKRLSQYAKVEEISLKEERIVNEDDQSQIARALDAEGERIIAQIPKGAAKIAMCVEGATLDSPSLSREIEKMVDNGGKVAIIIGSSHGLSDKVKAFCDLRLSVSRLTFPHQLMRLILLETLYRSFTIIAGKKYHK